MKNKVNWTRPDFGKVAFSLLLGCMIVSFFYTQPERDKAAAREIVKGKQIVWNAYLQAKYYSQNNWIVAETSAFSQNNMAEQAGIPEVAYRILLKENSSDYKINLVSNDCPLAWRPIMSKAIRGEQAVFSLKGIPPYKRRDLRDIAQGVKEVSAYTFLNLERTQAG